MADDLYDRLSDIFNMIGFGSRRSPELEALLKALFTREEAELAVNLSPLAPEPPKKLAERLGKDPEQVARMLDGMADKGVIYSSTRNGEKWYKLIQLVPGIFELQFMKGEYTPRAQEIARLFDNYHHALRPKEETRPAEAAPAGGSIHFARVIPIEQTITPQMNIFPFEVASKYIEDADMITLSTCYCRHEKRLLGKGCKYPDDVCLQLGPFAEFVKERGFGREISKEEALNVMRKSADAGLIHTSSNTQERIDFICNCCTCCCGILQGVSFHHAPVRTVSSNYEAVIEEDTCTGCGICVDMCQMNAINIDTGMAQIDLNRCIGCGVCVYHCDQEAVTLQTRSDFVEPPKSFRELIAKQAQGKR
ncbi:MAG: 4Fe-4S binding protein [Deltaproteobacteria bacterium]|nr:4Fe-4S binding protein [Deltaproteobacteria bacterium]